MVRTPIIILMIIMLLFLVSYCLKSSLMSFEKKSNFECGFDPNHENRNSFSIRFFLITVIFLLFDLEITFILSLPMSMKNNSLTSTFLVHYTIFFLFLMSTYLEWKQGALNWFWFDI